MNQHKKLQRLSHTLLANKLAVISFLIILSLIPLVGISQKVEVKTIIFTETVDKSYQSKIPFVVDKTSKNGLVVSKINDAIKDRFRIDSFNPKTVKEFRWYDVEFTSQVKENILHIEFIGEYYGAHLNDVHDNLYFDLSNGSFIKENQLPFTTFFTLEGYYSFLNKYWLAECTVEYDTATKCADMEPDCNCYDIEYKVSQKDIFLNLTYNCLPYVTRGCSPSHSISMPTDILREYLNDFGKWIIFESDFYKRTRLERFLFYKENSTKIPNYRFISGKIDKKYKFNMALELDETTKKVKGYYYYEKQKKHIALTGTFNSSSITLSETINGETTGRFDFKIHKEFQIEGIGLAEDLYLTGNWVNTKTNKIAPIAFQFVKDNRK